MRELFSSGSQSIGVSASASVLRMNTPGLTPYRIDWLDLLAVQGTLKSLLQHHSSKESGTTGHRNWLCDAIKQTRSPHC